MDEFEREYFRKLKPLASDFRSKRRELASSRMKMFVAAMCRQLIEKKEIFELLIASGNSGLYMAKIAEMVYEELKIKQPQLITLPIYRFEDANNSKLRDNVDLRPLVKGNLNNLSLNTNVLFVDDEIMRGITVKDALELILDERSDLNSMRIVIIAENHFFEWHYKMPRVSLNFFAYARLIQDLNGNIGYFISEELYKEIRAIIPEVQSPNHAMAIVIGGASKNKNTKGIPYYDTSVEEKLKIYIANYDNKKSQLKNELKELIKETVEEYKQGKIKFRF